MTSDNMPRRPSTSSPHDPPRYGDLVVDAEGYYGVVIGVEGDSPSGLDVVLFLGNGLTVERHWNQCQPRRLPHSPAISNYAEILKSPGECLKGINRK